MNDLGHILCLGVGVSGSATMCHPPVAPLEAGPSAAAGPLECVCFTLIIDDIVLPDGRTVMSQLGGSGAQSLFGYQLVNAQRSRVGLAAGVGPDLPESCKAWLHGIGVDTTGLVMHSRPTPRAWQVFESDGRRTQIYRTPGDPCESLFEMLRPKFDVLPEHFQTARNYHIGIHPSHPPLRLLRSLRAAACARGGLLSVEPYTSAESPLSQQQLTDLLGSCDIFSPNELEAVSMIGLAPTEQLLTRLFEAAGGGGAHTIVMRCGEAGVVAACRSSLGGGGGGEGGGGGGGGAAAGAVAGGAQASPSPFSGGADQQDGGGSDQQDEGGEALFAWAVPAVAGTAVVDVTGCGNAFCGAFLAAHDRFRRMRPEEDLLEAAVWGCVAAAYMAEVEGVPKARILDLQVPALTRVEALRPHATRLPLRMPPRTPAGGGRAIVQAPAQARMGGTGGVRGAHAASQGAHGRPGTVAAAAAARSAVHHQRGRLLLRAAGAGGATVLRCG